MLTSLALSTSLHPTISIAESATQRKQTSWRRGVMCPKVEPFLDSKFCKRLHTSSLARLVCQLSSIICSSVESCKLTRFESWLSETFNRDFFMRMKGWNEAGEDKSRWLWCHEQQMRCLSLDPPQWASSYVILLTWPSMIIGQNTDQKHKSFILVLSCKCVNIFGLPLKICSDRQHILDF